MLDLRGLLSGRRVAPVLAVTALLTVTLLPSLRAQSLSWTTVNKVEFAGAMGAMMQRVTRAQGDQRQTFNVRGTRMRMDSGNTSTIMDMTDGRYTMLDHQTKTFYSMTAEDMLAQLEQARDQMAAFGGNPMAGAGTTEEGSYEIESSTSRTGRTRDIDGHSAEQVLTTIELVPTSPEGVEAAALRGRTVLFSEIWLSTDFPGAAEYRDALEKMGEALLKEGEGGMDRLLSQALAGNRYLKGALEKNRAEMQALEGVPVRTVLHTVSVPAGMAFDPDAVLEAADHPLEVGEMPSTPEAAMEMMREMLGSRMGGLPGWQIQEEEEGAPAGPTVQTITMRVVSTLEEIRTDPLPDDLFHPPPDYAERLPEWWRGG